MGNNSLSESNTGHIASKNKLLFIIIGIFSLFILSYILISFYYNTHFYMNTIINGVNTSNMTVEYEPLKPPMALK